MEPATESEGLHRGVGGVATTLAPQVPAHFPQDLERDIVFANTYEYHLRPIRPDDAAGLVEFHRHLSPRSCYLRFFTFHPTLSPQEVERFTCVDYQDRLALVVEVDGQLLAIGRFDRHVGTSEAEVAFVVADDYQYHGLASLLLDELARAARQRGILTFVADTLEENRSMLGVFFHSGFPVSTRTEYGTVTLRFSLDETAAYRSALAAREQSRRMTAVDPLRATTGGADRD